MQQASDDRNKLLLEDIKKIHAIGGYEHVISEIQNLILNKCNNTEFNANNEKDYQIFENEVNAIIERHGLSEKIQTRHFAKAAWEFGAQYVKSHGAQLLISLAISYFLIPPIMSTAARAGYSSLYSLWFGSIPSKLNPAFWLHFLPGREWASFLAFKHSTEVAAGASFPLKLILSEVSDRFATATQKSYTYLKRSDGVKSESLEPSQKSTTSPLSSEAVAGSNGAIKSMFSDVKAKFLKVTEKSYAFWKRSGAARSESLASSQQATHSPIDVAGRVDNALSDDTQAVERLACKV